MVRFQAWRHAAASGLVGAALTAAGDLSSVEVLQDEEGTAYSISGILSPATSPGLAKLTADDLARTQCRRFLDALAPRFGALPGDHRILGPEREGAWAFFKVRQIGRGIPVYGSEAAVKVGAGTGAAPALWLGRFHPVTGALPAPSPALPLQGARAAAREDLQRASVVAAIPAGLAGDPLPLEASPELVWYPTASFGSGFRLAWNLAVRANLLETWEYVVDARSGAVLLKLPLHCDAMGPATATAKDLKGVDRTFGTWLHGDGKYYLIDGARPMFDAQRSVFPDLPVGALLTLDLADTKPSSPVFRHLTSATNAWANPVAVSAHHHAGLAYEYYLKVHGRNSINGLGGTIRSFVNVAGPDGLGMDNAYWNGNGMFYGNGRTMMTPLAASLDVSGHELTHGVVGATAGLKYRGQSGAINESMADIFGSLIEGEDWKIGEDIVRREVFTTGAMRDMADPNQGLPKTGNGWQPAHMGEYLDLPVTQAGDYGGVHANSGIPNKAFYLLATDIGKDKAGQAYYRALTRYLGASSQFADLRAAVIQSLKDLYGTTEVTAAERAFDRVGIGPGPGQPPASRVLPVNPGPQYALLTRAGPGDGNTLYLADSAFRNPRPLSRTPLRSRPSVSDDGTVAVFVAADGRLRKVSTDPAAPGETVVEGNPVWAVAAVSRDGRRWAAVKSARDTSIWLGDFAGATPRRFPLYNAGGLGVRTAVYAASVDWDHAGESVLFDAYYRLAGTGGSSLEYRDVGLLKAWDRVRNRYDEGLMLRPFGDLADGHGAANPAFSENDPDLLLYEETAADGSILLMARDIEARKAGRLATLAMPGFPSFDKRDDGVAYTSRIGNDTVIAYLPVGPDRLAPSGAPATVAAGFKWPVIFAKGKRPEAPTRTAAPPAAERGSLKARISRDGALSLEVRLYAPSPVRIRLFGTDGRRRDAWQGSLPAGSRTLRLHPGTGMESGVTWIHLEAGGLRLSARAMAGP